MVPDYLQFLFLLNLFSTYKQELLYLVLVFLRVSQAYIPESEESKFVLFLVFLPFLFLIL